MKAIALLSCVFLTGCAGVSVSQLNANLTEKKDAPKGAVYYLPKPYLFVAEVPVAAPPAPAAPPKPAEIEPPTKEDKKGKSAKKGKGTKAAPPPAGGDIPETINVSGGAEAPKDGKTEAAPAAPSVPSLGVSDTSFGAVGDGYILKLVYLPDYSRPMALTIKSGFGNAAVKPTLVNGWMLTSYDATVDSQLDETLKELPGVIDSLRNPWKPAASGSDDASGGSAPGLPAPPKPILRPGLYEFKYDDKGNLIGFCPVTYFESTGTVPPTPAGKCT